MIENYATRRGHETRSLDYDYEAVMADLEVIIFVTHPRPQTGLTQKSVNKHVVSYKSCMKPSTLKL